MVSGTICMDYGETGVWRVRQAYDIAYLRTWFSIQYAFLQAYGECKQKSVRVSWHSIQKRWPIRYIDAHFPDGESIWFFQRRMSRMHWNASKDSVELCKVNMMFCNNHTLALNRVSSFHLRYVRLRQTYLMRWFASSNSPKSEMFGMFFFFLQTAQAYSNHSTMPSLYGMHTELFNRLKPFQFVQFYIIITSTYYSLGLLSWLNVECMKLCSSTMSLTSANDNPHTYCSQLSICTGLWDFDNFWSWFLLELQSRSAYFHQESHVEVWSHQNMAIISLKNFRNFPNQNRWVATWILQKPCASHFY